MRPPPDPLSPLPGNGPVTSPTSTQPPAISSQTPLTSAPVSSPPPPTDDTLSLTTNQVRRELQKCKARKAAGPDGISSRLLKSCADQLCGIVELLFNLSLKQGRVPQLWKTSCVVPVPKTPQPKEFNSYRPVALTSQLMKTLERLVLGHLRPLVGPSMDPLQFAYQPAIGVDDTVIYLLQVGEVPQYVRTRECQSDTIISSTGAPQGTVLVSLHPLHCRLHPQHGNLSPAEVL